MNCSHERFEEFWTDGGRAILWCEYCGAISEPGDTWRQPRVSPRDVRIHQLEQALYQFLPTWHTDKSIANAKRLLHQNECLVLPDADLCCACSRLTQGCARFHMNDPCSDSPKAATPAERLALVKDLLDPRDEDGEPLPALISREDALRLLDTKCPPEKESEER